MFLRDGCSRTSANSTVSHIFYSSSIISNVDFNKAAGGSEEGVNSCAFPIGTNRLLTFKITNRDLQLRAAIVYGYRRIGTNN